MSTIKLTKQAIDALSPSSNDTVYWDVSLPGFGVKITPKGKNVFIALYRVRGGTSRLRKYTIGPYGRLTLHHAREAAQRIFTARLDGRDPASEKLESRRRDVIDRIDELVSGYIKQHLAKLRSGHDVAVMLTRKILPRWSARSVHDITRRDVGELIVQVANERTAYSAHKLLKAVKHFFSWCVARGI